jgi:hypothetical protein
MIGARLALLVLAAAASLTLAASPARAQASEESVKAAFLPKFVRYVEMPPAARPAAGQPFYLCVIGRDSLGALLDRAASSETIDGHPLAVRRFPSAANPAIAGCHVAFVAGQAAGETGQMLGTLHRRPVLTITDARWGRSRGMIHFAVAGGRVRFHIDNHAAQASGLAISSRLLALAIDVRQADQ